MNRRALLKAAAAAIVVAPIAPLIPKAPAPLLAVDLSYLTPLEAQWTLGKYGVVRKLSAVVPITAELWDDMAPLRALVAEDVARILALPDGASVEWIDD